MSYFFFRRSGLTIEWIQVKPFQVIFMRILANSCKHFKVSQEASKDTR